MGVDGVSVCTGRLHRRRSGIEAFEKTFEGFHRPTGVNPEELWVFRGDGFSLSVKKIKLGGEAVGGQS